MTDHDKKFEEMKRAAREAGLPVSSNKETADLEALWAELDKALQPPDAQLDQPSYKEAASLNYSRRGHGSLKSIMHSTPAWIWISGIAAVLIFGVLSVQSIMVRATLEQMENQLSQMQSSLILASLHSDSAAERLEGILQLSEGEYQNVALIKAVTNRMEFDPSTNVRLASVRTLSRYADEPGMVMILESAARNESSPLVVLEILDLLRSRDPSRAEILWQEIREDGRFAPFLEKEIGQNLNPSTTNI